MADPGGEFLVKRISPTGLALRPSRPIHYAGPGPRASRNGDVMRGGRAARPERRPLTARLAAGVAVTRTVLVLPSRSRAATVPGRPGPSACRSLSARGHWQPGWPRRPRPRPGGGSHGHGSWVTVTLSPSPSQSGSHGQTGRSSS